MKDKKEIRKEILALRNALSDEEHKRGDFLITERLLGHQWFYNSSKILAYAAYGSELSLDELIIEALRLGKEVYIPRVEEGGMNFYRIFDLKYLTEGYKGIREPQINDELRYNYISGDEDVLLIMPGVAFDYMKNRIGYGKGYYDRFLDDKPDLQLRSIAVGFKEQLVEELPYDETDIRPYQVLIV
ncbi:MAG: 5-formyltetrahydrofolate cyclo-ligase [Lachnospiraceae bacterium]|nr:5-formyltetrahydrofolate cyclo-ligase [Lachnospiraceae bacterium]